MAKSRVEPYVQSGGAVMSGKIMVGHTAAKKRFRVLHSIKGVDVRPPTGGESGRRGDLIGDTIKGSRSRSETAKQIRAIRRMPTEQLSRSDPASKMVIGSRMRVKQARDGHGRFA